METKEALYQATKGSSLFDYCLFNKNSTKNNNEKNEFLSLLFKSLNRSEWFNVSDFSNLGEHPIDKGFTQVPIASVEVENDEFEILVKIFNEEEIKEIIKIINNIKSYGVLAIKELMDNERAVNKPKAMRSAFFKPFFSRKK